MKKRTISSILKNEFSLYSVCLSTGALRRASALNKNDFSRGHSCQNPPALAGGCLRKQKKWRKREKIFKSY